MKKNLIQFYNWIYPTLRHFLFSLQLHFRVMTPEATIAKVKQTGCSIARYGDGEFGLITKSNNPDFQQNDDLLAARLANICISNDPRILICIPHNFKSTRDCNDFAKKFWNWWLWENDNLKKIAELLQLSPWKTKTFGDAQITRPYMDWKDKSKCSQRFEDLKSLWQDKDVLIVEGTETKLGVGNDLLAHANSIQRIIAPATNAFSAYDNILAAAKQYGYNKLVLIALGPTATVLAYDLAMSGIQALDIGHIDIEYEWFLAGANHKTTVSGKATQETHTQITTDSKQDSVYLSQIILRIERG